MKSDSSFLVNHEILLPNRCHEGHQGSKSPVFTGFFEPMQSFPLDGRRGFRGNIVDNAVDMRHLIDDADGNTIQHIVGNAGPVSGHEVGGGDAAERQRIVIRPAVTHDADGAHGGEDREILAETAVEPGLGDLVAEDEVGVAQRVELFLRDIADDADGKTRAGEGLAHDQILR